MSRNVSNPAPQLLRHLRADSSGDGVGGFVEWTDDDPGVGFVRRTQEVDPALDLGPHRTRRELPLVRPGLRLVHRHRFDRFFIRLAEHTGKIVGFVAVSQKAADAEIEHLWVLPEFMSQGIGRHLFDAALEFCASERVRSIKVVADPNASGFYQRMGCEVVGDEPSRPAGRKLPALRYTLPIPHPD